MGNEVPEGVGETLFESYKEIQGGMVPMRLTGQQTGKVLWQATFLEVEFHEKFDESVFAKP